MAVELPVARITASYLVVRSVRDKDGGLEAEAPLLILLPPTLATATLSGLRATETLPKNLTLLSSLVSNNFAKSLVTFFTS